MGQPIRWDNITSRGNTEAMSGLNSAASLFRGAFDDLRGTLKERESIDAGNWQNTKANNTTAYLDRLAQYRTAEELRADQQSGALDRLRQSFGFQIDGDKVRGAADARAASLMDQAAKQITYGHMMTDEKVAPVAAAYRAAIQNKDAIGAQAALAQYQQLGGRSPDELLAYGNTTNRTFTEWGQKDQKHTLDLNKGEQEIAASKANVQYQQGMLGVARTNADTQRQSVDQQGRAIDFNIETTTADRAAARASGAAAALRNALKDNGNLYAVDGVYTGDKASELMERMTKAGIGDDAGERSAVVNRINKLVKDGIAIKTPDGKKSIKITEIPMAAVNAAILGAEDQMINGWNQGYANSAEKNLKKILEAQVLQTGADGKAVLSNKMVTDLSDFRTAIKGAVDAPVPINPTNAPKPVQKRK